MRALVIVCTLAVFAAPIPAFATTWYLDAAGGGDYEQFYFAVGFASEGDTIIVAPGTYSGNYNRNIDPYGKNLVFIADTSTRAPVIIDCGHEAPAFYFHMGETASTIVDGFTIINGHNTSTGGGILCSGTPGASPTIRNCIFESNMSTIAGGALALYGSTSTVSDCVFRGNIGHYRGGAIVSVGSAATIERCLFDENTIETGTEGGGALFLSNGDTDVVTCCTMVENDLVQVKVTGTGSSPTISNCIIAYGPSGGSVVANSPGTALVTHCVLYGNFGGDTPDCDELDNIYYNPLFCDVEADDYTLCDDSQASADVNPWSEQIGAYLAGCEACDTPVEPSTWGAVKALFR